jgi:hypothetical protein
MTATMPTFGDTQGGVTSSAPAVTGGGAGGPTSAPAFDINNPASFDAGIPGSGQAAVNAANQVGPAVMDPTTGLNAAPDAPGWFGGVKDFLRQNKDIISLGTGALGVGNAIMKNSQMQGGIDALTAQARQAQMNSTQFQQGYNDLLAQALPLIQQGANGQVNPQQAASLLATANRMKTEINARYASSGGGGQSTARQQDLANVDLLINGLQGTLATAQIDAGARVAGAATGQGGLNQGQTSSIQQLARLNAASDQDLTQALQMFASAAGRGAANT